MPHGERPDSMHDETTRPGRWGSVALVVGALAVLTAMAVLAHSAITTASARIAGDTDNTSSLLRAAVVELDTGAADEGDDAGQRTLFLDGAGLHPGLVIERCLLVRYTGSLTEVPLILSAWLEAGTGLERHLDVVLTAGSGVDPQCGDFVATRAPMFDGTLADLAARHPRFDDGLWVADLASAEAATVRVQVEVVSDDAAQGRTTRVGVRFEVRP